MSRTIGLKSPTTKNTQKNQRLEHLEDAGEKEKNNSTFKTRNNKVKRPIKVLSKSINGLSPLASELKKVNITSSSFGQRTSGSLTQTNSFLTQ